MQSHWITVWLKDQFGRQLKRNILKEKKKRASGRDVGNEVIKPALTTTEDEQEIWLNRVWQSV